MKKITILLTLMFITTFGSFAQSYQEVVYLNNGSILKGNIIERVPFNYLKIETSSGKIYKIDMREVEKITTERQQVNTQSSNRSAPVENRSTQSYDRSAQSYDRSTQSYNRNTQSYDRSAQSYNRNTQSYDRSAQSPTRRQYNNNQYTYQNTRALPAENQSYNDDSYYDNYSDYSYFPNSGYKGFIELGFSFGTNTRVKADYGYRSRTETVGGVHRFEFSTSHGFFFNPYFFLGVGAGIHFYTGYTDENDNYQSFDEVDVALPIFANIRSHFTDSKASPFIDVKLGYSVHEITGTYFSPSVGCRFAKGSRSAFWVSMGYTLQQSKEEYSGFKTSTDFNAFSIKLGWDF